jgi:hypothetical protein
MAELMGDWAKSNHSRPSFTCQAYQINKCSFCDFWPAKEQIRVYIYSETLKKYEYLYYCSERCHRADYCWASQAQKEKWKKEQRTTGKIKEVPHA